MVATSKKTKAPKKRVVVGLSSQAMEALREVSQARGWKYAEAVKRMALRELELVRTEAGLHQSAPMSGTIS